MHFNQLNLLGFFSAFCAYEIEALALRYGVRREELQRLREVVRGPLPVKRGEILYRQGARGDAIFAVADGSFKASAANARGQESILDLYFQGDFLGLEALGGETHGCTLEALEPGSVFKLSVPELATAVADVPGLERELIGLMSREICRREEHRMLVGQKDAASKLASFLLYLSRRAQTDGSDPVDIRLHLRRQDMASYLGLATETVSRLLNRFARNRLIDVAAKRIKLRNRDEISRLAGGKNLWAAAALLLSSPWYF